MKKMLRLIRGLPGSGKTTFAHSPRFKDMLVIESDQYWVDANGHYAEDLTHYSDAKDYMYEMTEFALKCGVNVIVCDVFNHETTIQKYRLLADRYDYDFEVNMMRGRFESTHPDNRAPTEFDLYDGEMYVVPLETGEYFIQDNKKMRSGFDWGDPMSAAEGIFHVDELGNIRPVKDDKELKRALEVILLSMHKSIKLKPCVLASLGIKESGECPCARGQ